MATAVRWHGGAICDNAGDNGDNMVKILRGQGFLLDDLSLRGRRQRILNSFLACSVGPRVGLGPRHLVIGPAPGRRLGVVVHSTSGRSGPQSCGRHRSRVEESVGDNEDSIPSHRSPRMSSSVPGIDRLVLARISSCAGRKGAGDGNECFSPALMLPPSP